MKKIAVILLLLVNTILFADKTLQYRGVFPANRGNDAAITNYILLKQGTIVEFSLEEQGKGLTSLVKIVEVQLTSDAKVTFSDENGKIESLKVVETGIYQVKLVPTAVGGGEIRFVLNVIEKEDVPIVEPRGQTVAASPAQELPVSMPSLNQSGIGVTEEGMQPPVAVEPALPASAAVQIASAVPEVQDSPVVSTASVDSMVADSQLTDFQLVSPAADVYLSPLRGMVFSVSPTLQNAAAIAKSHCEIFLLRADGEKQPVEGQFFSSQPGQVTFLPNQLLPGAVYNIADKMGTITRRSAFPELKSECEFAEDMIRTRVFWLQLPDLLPNPLGQKLKLEDTTLEIFVDGERIFTIEPANSAPFGVEGAVSYNFKPYEMLCEIKRAGISEFTEVELVVIARIDGSEQPIICFKQEFKNDFMNVPAHEPAVASPTAVAPASEAISLPIAEEKVEELADLPEEINFSLAGSFAAYENPQEKNRAWPEELVWCEDGRLWLIDSQRRRVMNFSSSGQLIRAFGEKGEKDGALSLPVALALRQGKVYLADPTQNCLHVFAVDGSFLARVTSTPDQTPIIAAPGSLCFRKDELWVVDRGLVRITCFDHEGRYLGGFGNEDTLGSPMSVRADADGLFVLEKSGVVRKFSPMGVQTAGFQTGCLEPRGFDVDTWGTIWVADAGRFEVVRFNQKGRILKVLKAPPGPRPWLPTGVAVRKDGMIAVSDAENKQIHLFAVEP